MRPTRIFFASDLHGSEVAFRKFLGAAEHYHADALVFGGDLMGKALVPIVGSNGAYRARFLGRDNALDADELGGFCRAVERAGFYWSVMTRDEYEAARADPLLRQGAFQELAAERLRRWIELAQDRLAGSRVRMYLTGGNDDDPTVLEVLESADGQNVVACEGSLCDLDGEHTMITVGLSTYTPWETPREASEEEVADAIDASAAGVADTARCVFNLHCPPKGSPLDTCLKVVKGDDGEFRPVLSGGRFETTSGGSEAVRRAVLTYQPLAGLHGHIHESMGRFRLGRTLCFNPGSDYGQGNLQGWLVILRGTKVSGYQPTWG